MRDRRSVLTVSEGAELIGATATYVAGLVAAGEIPSEMRGGVIYVRKVDLIEYEAGTDGLSGIWRQRALMATG